MTRSQAIGIAAGSGAALCWGSSTVLSKDLLHYFDPVSLLVIQLLSSVTLLWALVFWTSGKHRPETMPASRVAGFAWLGALEPALAYFLCLWGLKAVSASGATLVQASESVLIVGVTAASTRSLPSPRFLGVSVVALAALSFAVSTKADAPTAIGSPSGIALVGAGTLVAAVYVVLSGRVAHRAPALTLTAWQQTVAFALVMLAWAVPHFIGSGADPFIVLSPAALLRTNLRLIGRAAASGILQFAVPFSLYMVALRRLTANVAGATLLLIPLVGLLDAHLFLGEQLSCGQWAASIITLTAVAGLALVGSPACEAHAITTASA